MTTIQLLPFQAQATEEIAQRFVNLWEDDNRPMETRRWSTPFYQALSALTGAGKTPILADAVAQIRAHLPVEPLVLWISKAKAVVDQTYTNFEAGGKYAHLIEGFVVTYLSELTNEVLSDTSTPLIVLSTVGTFNQKDKADGTLRVHKVEEDKSSESLWSLLRSRGQIRGKARRPLVIVYDEAHNLSDQQTELLLELEPDAFLVASATMRVPERLGRIVERLKEHVGPEQLVTSIPSKAVVEAGLVKRQIVLGGYSTLMEVVLSDMMADFERACSKADEHNAGFKPKAIYVCRTNISQDDGTQDNPARPFKQRKAPPILIWRYLTEQRGVDPSTIAVYCDLRFDRKEFPPPKGFVLFSGGEEDFSTFTSGDYQHIIFNLSLQEGWDDPACSFAYIDKSMGSTAQVEQVIGRVLRQPGARHYADMDLNTANFYIRVDDKQEFPRILETVRRRISAELPEIKLESYLAGKSARKHRGEPKSELVVPEVHIDSEQALEKIAAAVETLADYRRDRVNTVGRGQLVRAIQAVGDDTKARITEKEIAHSNRVVAGWLMRRAIQAIYPEVIKTIDWTVKVFDAKVELSSPAAVNLRDAAGRLVDLFIEYSDLVCEPENLYHVGPVALNPAKAEKFENAGHESYSDLNGFELEIARHLDATELTWVRNPVSGGFSIPLLEKGSSKRFYPDFLVWKGNIVYAIDPKGSHLITSDAGRKLLNLADDKGKQRIVVRLITEGRWQPDPIRRLEAGGYTVWSLSKSGKLRARHQSDASEVVSACLAG